MSADRTRSPSEPDGKTPLEQEELDELIPTHLTTRDELNAWEQANIAQAALWLERRRSADSVLTMVFVRELHKRMFGLTWRWAGKFRRSGKNLGVDWRAVPQTTQQLLADTSFWVAHQTYSIDETAARFHHRLVQIHPFPNGNGRHGRLITDALLDELRAPRFTWGSHDLIKSGDVRAAYLHALRAADNHDYSRLMAFVRS